MSAPSQAFTDSLGETLKELSNLRQFNGAPKDFWPRFQSCLVALSSATRLVLLVRDKSQPAKWKKIGDWSANSGPAHLLVSFTMQVEDIAERCAEIGSVVLPMDRAAESMPYALGLRLALHGEGDLCVAALLVPAMRETEARETLLRLALAADVPKAYQAHQLATRARADVENFAAALDVATAVNHESRFVAAAVALCNGVATRFQCDRVSLGWLDHGYVKLAAMSRTEHFDRQMAAAKALEVAMEEALDQDEEVFWPELSEKGAAASPDDAHFIARDHEKFAKEQSVANVCSLPLRAGDKAVAVLTCERQSAPFTALDLQRLRLCCDQVTCRLADLKEHDRWFGARWLAASRRGVAKLVGPEHTLAKVIAVLVVLALAALLFIPVPYRVEGNFILRSDSVSYLTAPFDGYIDEVFVRPGDVVEQGAKLLGLDTRELKLEEAAALADLNRYTRESEKARAAKQLADMRIQEALAAQARARLDMIRYRLENSIIHVPFSGVVVEGDLRERLKAPVKQGDALIKIARLDTLYVEAEVNERDVHEVLNKRSGEIAFVSQPKLKFPVHITRIEPAAMPKKDANVFVVRCGFERGAESWWRPGMSGVAKLDVDKRTLAWILTHRTIDFLRMYLWW